MTKSLPVALVAAGRLRDHPVLRLNSVVEQLGPVKAPSYRQASRISNTLRAGHPVKRYEDLSPSRTIFICSPESRTIRMVDEIAASRLSLKGRIVLLCCSRHGSETLHQLAELGAAVGSLNLVSESDELRFLVEGDRAAVRLARSLVEEEGGHVTEVEPGTWQLCAAAFAFSSWLLQPLVDASVEGLRNAGLSPGSAGPIVDLVLQRAARSYLKAGRRAWKPPRSVRERQTFLRQIEAVQRTNPELATYLRSTAIETLRHMGRSSVWLEQTQPLLRRAAAAGD